MNNKAKDPLVHQLKILENIADVITKLLEKNKKLKGGQPNVFLRTVIEPNDTTLHKEGFHGKGVLNHGVRGCDYKFSAANPDWAEASDVHGLSFTSTMEHAVGTIKFLG